MKDEQKMDEFIEELKTKHFKSAYRVRQIIDSVIAKEDFYRKADLIEVLWFRYDNLSDGDFNGIIGKLKQN